MKENLFTPRRHFLKMAGLTAVATGFGFTKSIAGNSSKKPVENPVLKPVKVSADRLIRTVVGLRPYRPSGFKLTQEKINNHTIIHNYGHGGAGITLSWGTAKLAVDMVVKINAKKIAVLGSGVIGLSTGILLLKTGFDVTIYTKDTPPNTTSNIAAALWFPVSVFDEGKADTKFLMQFEEACHLSHRMFQDYLGDQYGVRWIDNYNLGMNDENFPGGNELYPEITIHHDPKTYFGYEPVQHYKSMMIETPVYINSLMKDFLLFGGKLKIKEFNSIQDIARLSETVVMNCTGLGSGKLFNDESLVAVRGQLCVLLPQPEINYSYVTGDHENILYMFPRKDGIILGGTFDKGNWSLEPDQQVTKRILNGHSAIAKSIGG